jgi:alpha-galactosidase
VGHIAAGIFESQRIADTSGCDWERTRRYEVNGLTHRIAQHRTFSHIDPDIVALAKSVGWRETSQWMDVVAKSGTSLFFAPEPGAITADIKAAMAEAFGIVSSGATGFPANPLLGATPCKWVFERPNRTIRNNVWGERRGIAFSGLT